MAFVGEGENAYRVFGLESRGRETSWKKPRRRWQCNIVEPGYNDTGLYDTHL